MAGTAGEWHCAVKEFKREKPNGNLLISSPLSFIFFSLHRQLCSQSSVTFELNLAHSTAKDVWVQDDVKHSIEQL